jgi:GTP-dependent phosphoenolpyruvate carboxykinase
MATAHPLSPSLPQISPAVAQWVESVRALTQPANVQWCDGSDGEYRDLMQLLRQRGELQDLNPETFPAARWPARIRPTSRASNT